MWEEMHEYKYSVANPLSCTIDETNTSLQPCFKITISGCTFSNFGKFKRSSKPPTINKNMGIIYYG